jgi:hypothetical protein
MRSGLPPASRTLRAEWACHSSSLAETSIGESLSTIFTVEHDHFETYRIKGRTRFRIVPER